MNTITTESIAGGPGTRILREGYGDGSWHGPDLKAALTRPRVSRTPTIALNGEQSPGLFCFPPT